MKTMLKFLSFAAVLAVAAAPAAHADTLGGPGVYFGNGNPNVDFTVATTGNVQLGLKAIVRGVADPIMQSGNDYIVTPGEGVNSHGVPNGDTLWNFVFSVNTGGATLDAYTYSITITDNANPSLTHTFDPSPAHIGDDALVNGSGAVCNSGTTSPCPTTYDPSQFDGFQNSENLGFGFLPGFDVHSADAYTITLTAYSGLDVVASDTINVVPTPEPSSLILLGTGVVSAAGTFLRRRRLA